MKYANNIIVNVPIDFFLELFIDSKNLKHWQPGFIEIINKEGVLGEKGSTSVLKYKMGKREVNLLETIILNDLPHAFHAKYAMKGGYNINYNYFKAIDEKSTEWTSKVEFRFEGLMMQLMAFIAPGSFRKQSFKFMENFKAYAERGESVAT